ncbi:hypothetical protein FACS1894151_01260 [Spirochaetia bacterium]|nr:hypothetical protein FACS1894151_01260 [Spirochaetia bacterium]
MEISKEIIVEEIRNMEKHYRKIEELFAKKPIPECKQIKETIESLKQIQYHKKYPNLKSKYPWLGLNSYFAKTIYIFSVTNFPYSKEGMEKKFEEISSKSSNKKILLCRINTDSPEWKNVQKNKAVCLYVGSSDGLQQRLKEHLCLCNPSAYAMHLEKWFESNLTITINTWGFYEYLDGEPSDYLQNIEDVLWNHYRPLFGRQGKK